MTRKYTFTAKDLEIIREARKKNKDKRAEVRLHALELRAEGKRAKAIEEAVGVSAPYVNQLAAKYFSGGIEAIAGNHYGGNRRNMSKEEEELILKPFYETAEKGELIEVAEINKAYQEKVDHKVGEKQIYRVLHRHGWRKIMPRSRHPKKATEEAIEASKKLSSL
jgi:transposase